MSQPTAATVPSNASNTLALIEAISRATTEATKGAIEQVKPLLEELITDTETRLAGIQAPKPMSIVVNGLPEVKLSKSPSPLLPLLIQNAALKHHSLIKGPSGSGKSTVAAQVAEALQLKFYHFVFSSDMGTSALFGRQTINGFVDSCIVQAIRNGGVLCLDEIDFASEQVLGSTHPLTDKSTTVYNPVTGEAIPKHPDLVIIACCNTWGKGADHVYTGRNRLDAASTQRFKKMTLNYSTEIETEIANKIGGGDLTLLKKFHHARAELKRLGAEEIVSTRTIERAYESVFHGLQSEKDALSFETADWPDGLAEQVGLVAETPKKKKGA